MAPNNATLKGGFGMTASRFAFDHAEPLPKTFGRRVVLFPFYECKERKVKFEAESYQPTCLKNIDVRINNISTLQHATSGNLRLLTLEGMIDELNADRKRLSMLEYGWKARSRRERKCGTASSLLCTWYELVKS